MRADDLLSKRDQGIIARERITQRYALARTFVWASAAIIIAYIGKDFLVSIAGKETILALKLSFFSDIKFAASLTLAGSAVAWAVLERWLRHRKVELMQERIKQLELGIDPKRTSSGLTTKGKTNPRDRQ